MYVYVYMHIIYACVSIDCMCVEFDGLLGAWGLGLWVGSLERLDTWGHYPNEGRLQLLFPIAVTVTISVNDTLDTEEGVSFKQAYPKP